MKSNICPACNEKTFSISRKLFSITGLRCKSCNTKARFAIVPALCVFVFCGLLIMVGGPISHAMGLALPLKYICFAVALLALLFIPLEVS